MTPGGRQGEPSELASLDDVPARQVYGDGWRSEVVEDLDVKRALVERVDKVRRAGTIVTSNTSGIPIAALGEGSGDLVCTGTSALLLRPLLHR